MTFTDIKQYRNLYKHMLESPALLLLDSRVCYKQGICATIILQPAIDSLRHTGASRLSCTTVPTLSSSTEKESERVGINGSLHRGYPTTVHNWVVLDRTVFLAEKLKENRRPVCSVG